MAKRLSPICVLLLVAALSPAPINDTRPLVVQPEKSQSERAAEQTGATLGEMGSTPERTENLAVPSITGDGDAASAVRGAKTGNPSSESSRKGAAAVQEASRDLAHRGRPNWGRIFGGGLIVVAVLGLFAVFRMWANKALPDAPDVPNNSKF